MNQERKARQYVWLDPSDCDPPHGLDLCIGSRDSIKVDMLTEAFAKNGFDVNQPALIGYPLNGKIQLVSGTHRHEAAKRAGIRLPVEIRLRSEVEAKWGIYEKWQELITDIPVKDLESALIRNHKQEEDFEIPGLDNRVDLTRDIYK